MKFLIWDLPTRLFHWLLAGSVVLAFGLAEFVEKETPLFYLHVVFGVLAGLLILWRVVWGLIGSDHARWSRLFFSPASTINYFKDVITGRGKYYAGHNPGGAITVLFIMVGVALSVLSGLLITQSEVFEELHEALPVMVMVLVAVHVVGVLLATKMHNEPYALAMITGKKRAQASEAIPHSSPFAAVIMLVLVLGAWFYFIAGFDRNNALFTAPGTQWSYQIGEAEEGEGGDASEKQERSGEAGGEHENDNDDD